MVLLTPSRPLARRWGFAIDGEAVPMLLITGRRDYRAEFHYIAMPVKKRMAERLKSGVLDVKNKLAIEPRTWSKSWDNRRRGRDPF